MIINLPGKTLEQVLTGPLPKAEACTLRPKSSEFFKFADFRAVLEAALGTRYTTLTSGTTIGVEHNGERWEVDVVSVEPDEDTPAVSLIDTDVVVDLQPPLGADGLPAVIPDGSEAASRLGPRRVLSSSQLGTPSTKLDPGGPPIEVEVPADSRTECVHSFFSSSHMYTHTHTHTHSYMRAF